MRADDAVGRFGGDEFLVLASVHDLPGAHKLAAHLLDAVRACASTCQAAQPVSASIGYALAPHDATQALRLLQLADNAMYAAKRAGKSPVIASTRGSAERESRRHQVSEHQAPDPGIAAEREDCGRGLEQQHIDEQLRARGPWLASRMMRWPSRRAPSSARRPTQSVGTSCSTTGST